MHVRRVRRVRPGANNGSNRRPSQLWVADAELTLPPSFLVSTKNTFDGTMQTDYGQVKANIDFILSHFEGQHELFPRTIQTYKTGGQVKMEYESDVNVSIDKIFAYFMQADFKDCKINAFPFKTEYTQVDLEVKIITAATFIMIDLDLKDFGNRDKLDKQLKKTTNKMSLRFNGDAHPTVLWTGNGYHVYQPIDGIVFEREQIFHQFLEYVDKDLTTEFLRFAERFFTDGKSDPQHSPSIKSCLVRVPGTINSKNGEQVRVVQRWDGKRPSIKWITTDFRVDLIQKRHDKIEERKRADKIKSRIFSSSNADIPRIGWIERLLQTPLNDYRKFCLWRILCPYLINIKKLSGDEAAIVLKEWLQNCDHLKNLNFNSQMEIKYRLRYVGPYLPSPKEKLKKEQPELYQILKSNNIMVD